MLNSASERDTIVAALRFDKRRKGSAGRALIVNLPTFGLMRGDRLEPSADLVDVCVLDERADFLFEVVFWRPQNLTRVKHRCPLLAEGTGLTLDALAIDILHTLHSGIVQHFVAVAAWELLRASVWRIHGRQEEVEQMGDAV